MKKYIDLSQFNVVTDWAKVAANVDGVILRAGYRGYGSTGTLVKDARFSTYLTNALNANIPVGIYFMSQAITETEATAEADFVASLIKGCKITFPIYFDSEWSHKDHDGRADTITAMRRTDCALAFCARIKALGYTPGVYAAEKWFQSMLQLNRLSGLRIWCAKYSTNEPAVSCNLWQYTNAANVPGIVAGVDMSHDMVPTIKYDIWSTPLGNIDRLAYVPMYGTKGETVSAAATREHWNGKAPDAIWNVELFNRKTYAPASGVVHDGKVQLLTQTVGVALVDNLKPVLSYANNVHALDWIGAYPILIRDGKIAFDPSKLCADQQGVHAWTVTAWTDTTLAVITVRAENACTLYDLALVIQSLGYTMAINHDGGGSTAVVTPDMVYDQGRAVRGKLGVWLKGGTGNKLTHVAADADGKMHQDMTKVHGVSVTITANGGLKLRKAPDLGAKVAKLMPEGSTAMWYGFYCIKNGVKWLYVRFADSIQGYAAAKYLKEE